MKNWNLYRQKKIFQENNMGKEYNDYLVQSQFKSAF